MIVVAIAFAGCGSGDGPSGMSTPSSVARGPIVTALETDAIADGIIAGQLVEDQGCLFVDDGRRRPLLLSSGTSWDEATRSVVNPDGSTVATGQRFSAQGGSEDLSSLVPYFIDDAQLPSMQRCAELAGADAVSVVGALSSA